MPTLATPIGSLNRIGKTVERPLARLGVKTIKDLLLYFPYRYDDFRRIVLVRDLVEGERVTVRVTVAHLESRRSFKKRLAITEGLAGDESGSIRIFWFNQPYLDKIIKSGDTIFVSGVVERDMLGPKFVSPVFEKVKAGTAPVHTGRLVPVYSLTRGVSEKQIRFLLGETISYAEQLPEWLPESVLESEDLLPIAAAVRGMHYPADEGEVEIAQRRLKFDELLLIQLKAELARRERNLHHAPKILFREKEIRALVGGLPFTLTKSQKQAAWDIMKDMGEGAPMNRLLSGDVGSGKTVVAGLACYLASLGGYGSAFMAPTEILARQHYATLQALFKGSLSVGLLTNEYAEAEGAPEAIGYKRRRAHVVAALNEGHINVIIGTQALLTDDVVFKKLGLVVVDEQHRFGVSQRQLIRQKGLDAHFLSMTATPIPRSLALALYGDLAISLIPELPPGRKSIVSRLVPGTKRAEAYDFVRKQIVASRQVFVVCPLIEAGDGGSAGGVTAAIEKKSVLAEYEKLKKKIFPEFSVAFLHGKLKAVEKDAIMQDFRSGKTQILVSTSVIEVGVDVPNASIMLIEDAERFGLAQLHQFRGRVGRGAHQSFCFLFTENTSEKTVERLTYFANHSNGFELAEKDLELRGPGEVYGTDQSGFSQLKFARLTDTPIIARCQIIARDLASELPKYPELQKRLLEWEQAVHLE